MLETINAYAREQLEASDEADAVRARHAAYFVDLVEDGTRYLAGPEQQSWFARLERERANLLAAERWAAVRGDSATSLRLAAGLWPFWLAREDASNARERLETILQVVGQSDPSRTLARVLHGAALIAEKLGDYGTCRALLEHGVGLARQLNDRPVLASLLDSYGRQLFIEGRFSESRVALEESHALLGTMDDRVALARLLSHLGFLDFLEGRPAEARAIFERGLALAMAVQDKHRVAEFMDNLGNTYEGQDDLDQAARMFEAAIAIWRELGQGHWLAMALNNLGKVQVRSGDLESARGNLQEALSLAHRMGNRRRQAYTVAAVAALAMAEGDGEWAASMQTIASATIAEIGAAAPPRWPPVASATGHASDLTSPNPSMTFDRAVEESLVRLARSRPTSSKMRRRVPNSLTRREREVVSLVAMGQTNRQIAESLVLTEGTVENYVQRILGKLGVNNRAQVAVWALEHGLGRG
jgi:non-specific serine/threonine protein kinase